MQRGVLQLIAILAVLFMAQTVTATGDSKSWHQHWMGQGQPLEVITGDYNCFSNKVNIWFEGTSGIFATDMFECELEVGPNCEEAATTTRAVLEERGCTIVNSEIFNGGANFVFVCLGRRDNIVTTVGNLCGAGLP